MQSLKAIPRTILGNCLPYFWFYIREEGWRKEMPSLPGKYGDSVSTTEFGGGRAPPCEAHLAHCNPIQEARYRWLLRDCHAPFSIAGSGCLDSGFNGAYAQVESTNTSRGGILSESVSDFSNTLQRNELYDSWRSVEGGVQHASSRSRGLVSTATGRSRNGRELLRCLEKQRYCPLS